MSGNIFRTSNPLDFTQVDGIYINELPPPGAIAGIGNDEVCVIGEFERGPVDVITAVASTQEFAEKFGTVGPDAAGAWYEGALALKNKQFGRLRVIRVSNGTQALATLNLQDGGTPTDIIRVDALNVGAWGNKIKVEVLVASDGVAAHFDLKVSLDQTLVEEFRNVDYTAIADGAEIVTGSVYIKLTRLALGDGNGPAVIAATSLATGSDGTFADSDYTGSTSDVRGIELLKASSADSIRWVFVAERSNATVNAALSALVAANPTKIAIISGAVTDSKATVKTDVASYRSDRMVYAYPAVKTWVSEANGGKGGLVSVLPNSFAAAVASAIAPGRDPAGPGVSGEHRKRLTGVREMLDTGLSRSDYIDFNKKGIMALGVSPLGGFQFRSGITTSLSAGLETIARRTMADFLQESIAAFLQKFQNLPITRSNKLLIKGAIEDFLDRQTLFGLLPAKADLAGNLVPYIVDIESGNTPANEALGIFVIELKVRIFAAMRFIVLRTQIGQGVEITVDEVPQAA